MIKPKLELLQEMIEQDSNMGFCLNCGEEVYDIEPDAHEAECEHCGANQAYGAEQLLICNLYE